MENAINKVKEALELKLGEGYTVILKEKRKNNGLILHGICIHREGDSVSPVVYVDDYIQHCTTGEQSPEEIADHILETYRQDAIPQNVAVHVDDFGKMKELVGIRMINHTANISELGNVPHRRFLDLAVTYYLEMGTIDGCDASAIVTNELMERWGVTEDDLYRLGMEKLASRDGCCIMDMLSVLNSVTQTGQNEMAEESGKDRNEPMMYVATNRGKRFGAGCLLNTSILQDLAEKAGCSLIILPSSIHEIIIVPQKSGFDDNIDIGDVQEINATVVAREECLSNSIYRYDRERQEVSIFKEGVPLTW